ncbi:hypothetical protein Tco_0199875 [Tanacetum coccineum]
MRYWDHLGGLKVVQPFTCYSTREDSRNNVSIAKIDGEDNMLMQEVSISRIGSLVVWATIPREISYMTNHGLETTLDSGISLAMSSAPTAASQLANLQIMFI